MKIKNFYFLAYLSLIPIFALQSQTTDTLSTYYYNAGVSAVNKKDFEAAKGYFKKSINEEDNARAEYELAKIFRTDTSHYSWNVSRDHIKKAIALNPVNPNYHLFYGLLAEDLFNYSRIEFDTENDAVRELERTLELDSTNTTAANHLGEITAKRFLEYYISKKSESPTINFHPGQLEKIGVTVAKQLYDLIQSEFIGMEGYADDNFKISENALNTAVRYDPLNPKAYFILSSIYEEKKEPGKGVIILNKLLKFHPNNKEAHLNLGLLYYEVSKLDSSYIEFEKAFDEMPNDEQKDYFINSVKILLEPLLGDKLKGMNEDLLKEVISKYWGIHNPLILKEYNERILEHYARVTYSNLRFSVLKFNITGWKTDRGTIIIRYGMPIVRIRLRPKLEWKLVPKTEIWIYNDKTFAFTDDFENGKYVYGTTDNNSQYWGDTEKLVEELNKTQPEEYHPKFEAPVITVPNAAYQFKNLTADDATDLFISYGIMHERNADVIKNIECKYTAGIFLFDSNFNEIAEKKIKVDGLNRNNEISIPDSGNFFINTEELTAAPDSGNLAFEINMDANKGVSAYHGKFKLRNFNSSSLEMSDIILAASVEKGSAVAGRINRKDYSVLPNPIGIFGKDQKLYIYYEVYNLAKDKNDNTDFQQTILLKRKGEEKAAIGKVIGSVLKFMGLEKGQMQVGSTYKYQSNEKDSQVYFQFDMSNYEKGDYILTVELKDNNSGKEISSETEIAWR